MNNYVYCIQVVAYFVVLMSALVFYFANRSRSKFKFEFESKEFKFLKIFE
jgi:hypothetical protein